MEQLLLAAMVEALRKKAKERPLTGWEKDMLRAQRESDAKKK